MSCRPPAVLPKVSPRPDGRAWRKVRPPLARRAARALRRALRPRPGPADRRGRRIPHRARRARPCRRGAPTCWQAPHRRHWRRRRGLRRRSPRAGGRWRRSGRRGSRGRCGRRPSAQVRQRGREVRGARSPPAPRPTTAASAAARGSPGAGRTRRCRPRPLSAAGQGCRGPPLRRHPMPPAPRSRLSPAHSFPSSNPTPNHEQYRAIGRWRNHRLGRPISALQTVGLPPESQAVQSAAPAAAPRVTVCAVGKGEWRWNS